MFKAPFLSQVFTYGFRCFFIAAPICAGTIILLWMGMLSGWLLMPRIYPAPLWHAHEMIFGFIAAAIAGFLLTAVPNWCNRQRLHGVPLAGLVLLWVLGRLVPFLPSSQLLLAALIDCLFLATLAGIIGHAIYSARLWRNFAVVAIVCTLTAINGYFYFCVAEGDFSSASKTLMLALDLISLLVAVIAGRITPAFTQNWLRVKGYTSSFKKNLLLERLSLLSIALAGILAFLEIRSVHIVILFLASVFNLARLAQWKPWLTRTNPLLWVLHLAYLNLVIALLLRVLCKVFELPESVWVHFLAIACLGLIIFGVMCRVALGHTGRALILPKLGTVIFTLIVGAAISRLISFFVEHYFVTLWISALLWIASVIIFLLLFGPILVSPRADKKPG